MQSKRREYLQHLQTIIGQIENDATITLDTHWKKYFKECLDWANSGGETASLSDVEQSYHAAQAHVRLTIGIYETIISQFVCR